jgi:hypothetical protein
MKIYEHNIDSSRYGRMFCSSKFAAYSHVLFFINFAWEWAGVQIHDLGFFDLKHKTHQLYKIVRAQSLDSL